MSAMINSQQTGDIDRMVGVFQHWVNVLCLMARASGGSVCRHRRQGRGNFPSDVNSESQSRASFPAKTRDVCPMLG